MQKLIYFVIGCIVGCLATLAVVFVNASEEILEATPSETIEETFEQRLSRIDGVTLLTESSYTKIKTTSNKIKVFQSLNSGLALANIQTGRYEYEVLPVLLVDRDVQPFYDDQEIVIPKGGYIKQIGTYKYQTNLKIFKTVPIVEIIRTNNTSTIN